MISMFPEEVGILFMPWLSWSQGATPVVGCGRQWGFWSVSLVLLSCNQKPPATLLCEVTQLPLSCSTAMGVVGVGGEK